MIEGKLMTLVGTESPEYMKSVAEYIEEKNKEIRSGENGRRMNVTMASILTSINVADDYFKEKEKNNDLQNRPMTLRSSLKAAKKSLKRLKRRSNSLTGIYISLRMT